MARSPVTLTHSPHADQTVSDLFWAILARVGRFVMTFLDHLGRFAYTLWWIVRNPRHARDIPGNILQQMVQIGNDSIPIVAFVAVFVGMVTAVQSAYQLYSWIPRAVVGGLVVKSVTLELVPLLTALVLAGKVGATITAELGSMRVTEQIDALEAMGIDSIAFLITPRVLAGALMFPMLVVFGDLLAMLGGLFGAAIVSSIPGMVFIQGMKASFATWDVFFGMIKATVFGFAITSVACYQGYYVKGGSADVGKATMATVTIGSLAVVLLDFLLASVLL
jgi:phospholipid/cholesterol/gamma-HCH transport system permease protein